MYSRTFTRLGVFSAFVEELKKVPAYFSHKAQQGANAYVDAASQTLEFLKGEDPSESPEVRAKRRQHKETYQAILDQQAAKAAEERAKEKQERAQLSWKQRLQLSMQEAKEAVQQMTSAKAGVMALLQHCTASHAAEVAIEQGIDVKNVQMVFEKAAATNSVGFEEVVVGYIEAPSASQEEVMAFAEKLQKACPVANTMHIEWRHGRADLRDRDSGSVRRADTVQEEMDRAALQVDWEASRGGTMGQSGGASPQTAETASPRGTPGAQRVYPTTSRSVNRSFDSDDNAFHLPGVKTRKTDTAAEEMRSDNRSTRSAGASDARAPEKKHHDGNAPPPLTPPSSPSAAPASASSDEAFQDAAPTDKK